MMCTNDSIKMVFVKLRFLVCCMLACLSLKDLDLKDTPLLLLALYEKATLSRASALPFRQLLPDVRQHTHIFVLMRQVLLT